MTPSKLATIYAFCFTVGAAFLALFAIPKEVLVEAPSWMAVAFSYLWIPGTIFLLAGFAALISYFLTNAFEHFLKNSKYYDCRKAKISDLSKIYEMADDLFDWDVSPVESMKRWQKHNSTIFWIIEKYEVNKNSKKKSFEGYFCVIPITEEATNLLLTGEITGTNFEKRHIIQTGKDFENVYIGGVAGTSRNAKGFAMMGLKQYLNYLIEQGLKRIITRPVSDDGLKVVMHHGFTSIGPNENIGNLFEIK